MAIGARAPPLDVADRSHAQAGAGPLGQFLLREPTPLAMPPQQRPQLTPARSLHPPRPPGVLRCPRAAPIGSLPPPPRLAAHVRMARLDSPTRNLARLRGC